MRAIFAALVLVTPFAAHAQSVPSPTRPATSFPPNIIDRSTATSDARAAETARRAAADRAAAERARQTAVPRGPVAGSTMSDGVAGTGTSPGSSLPAPTPPPPR